MIQLWHQLTTLLNLDDKVLMQIQVFFFLSSPQTEDVDVVSLLLFQTAQPASHRYHRKIDMKRPRAAPAPASEIGIFT